ncbi:MAG: Coenzyme PQQ synthesis protein E [Syntrophomonadaceae bacterium]|nr:Coenzyme PQQ synthesis protein E [Bacillota bacterium]
MVHTFMLHGLMLALDVESGAVHVLDEPAFFAVREITGGQADSEVWARLASRHGAVTAGEVMAEINGLRNGGLLFSKQKPSDVAPDGVVKALCLHLAHDCNLRCRYCFAGGGAFGGDRSQMSAEVALRAVDFLLSASGGRRHCEIDFFGGEPLLNFKVLQEAVAYGLSRAKGLGKELKFTVTTNAFFLPPAVQEYLNSENVSIVLSLDGRREVHDRMRRQPDGAGSFQQVLDNCRSLVAGRGGDNYYLRGTYTRCNLDFSNDVLAMVDEGFTRISLEPAVLPDHSPEALQFSDLPRLEREYERLAELLWQMEQAGRRVHFFHFELDLHQGPCTKKRAQGCGAGTSYLAVTPDGGLYPCHQFAGLEQFRAGDVFSGPDGAVLRQFQAPDTLVKEECRICFARGFCGGGCHASAWLINGDLLLPYGLGCALHRKRVECALYLQARRLSRAKE